MALPRSAMGLSAVCDLVFPYHTHLLFFIAYANSQGSDEPAHLRTLPRAFAVHIRIL